MAIAGRLKRFDQLSFEAVRKFSYNNTNTSVLGLGVSRVFWRAVGGYPLETDLAADRRQAGRVLVDRR